ncbi:cation:dicarboxylate symporter family transporter [Rickettsia hoogstraalii]|uniref:cation:dicarboxylate symporter family transporter n=1 Tax=Rickettsia hoogstraalii TaxID=467174 RepID=UPI0022521E3B|nr:cation:dicarboxylase symporter family transporter [Rickettsia hoogstraalii]
MFRKMPLILMAIIIAIILFNPLMSLEVKRLLYSISLSIKSIIGLFLPLIIFGLLFKSVVMLAKDATRIVFLILLLVCGSNFCSTFISHYVGIYIYQFDLSMISPIENDSLKPLWLLNFPNIISNDKIVFSSIILGFISSKFCAEIAIGLAFKIEAFVAKILRLFIYIIPLFIMGFIVKLQFDEVLGIIIKDYMFIFGTIAFAQFGYIFLAYFILSNCRVKEFIASLSNMMPASISGFSAMSSVVSMPLSIIGSENNTNNKALARTVVPITVNIHLVGDCFAISILAYAILKSYGLAEPTLFNYLIFAFYFVLAKFSVAAIPGGGIIVMLPILEQYLGFNTNMMSLITALYILFDPVITCANVLGNGAFVKLIDNI